MTNNNKFPSLGAPKLVPEEMLLGATPLAKPAPDRPPEKKNRGARENPINFPDKLSLVGIIQEGTSNKKNANSIFNRNFWNTWNQIFRTEAKAYQI